jgi:cell division protease FtsH
LIEAQQRAEAEAMAERRAKELGLPFKDSESTEGSERPETSESTEGSERPETSENSETSKKPEQPESSENN